MPGVSHEPPPSGLLLSDTTPRHSSVSVSGLSQALETELSRRICGNGVQLTRSQLRYLERLVMKNGRHST